MPLRQIMPEPFQLEVYPKITSTTTNQMGDKKRTDSTQPVTRGATSIRTRFSKEIINPAYLDRIVTECQLAVHNPREWKDGDLVVMPGGMGKYRVDGDSKTDDMGPMTSMNHLFGGVVYLKRVN